MRSQRFILIMFMVTLGSGALAYYLPDKYRKRTLWGKGKGGEDFPPMKFFIGTGVVFFGISAVGEFKPGLAGPFAALVGVSSGLYNGVPALEYLAYGGTAKKAPATVDTKSGDLLPNLQTSPPPRVIHFPDSETAIKRSASNQTHTIVVPGTQGKKIRLKANG